MELQKLNFWDPPPLGWMIIYCLPIISNLIQKWTFGELLIKNTPIECRYKYLKLNKILQVNKENFKLFNKEIFSNFLIADAAIESTGTKAN